MRGAPISGEMAARGVDAFSKDIEDAKAVFVRCIGVMPTHVLHPDDCVCGRCEPIPDECAPRLFDTEEA